ncbi:MAG: response regulator [Gammaproteobacteria bacterium]|nr:MAG: response regulator [Gammaproteobacteria bacterium]
MIMKLINFKYRIIVAAMFSALTINFASYGCAKLFLHDFDIISSKQSSKQILSEISETLGGENETSRMRRLFEKYQLSSLQIRHNNKSVIDFAAATVNENAEYRLKEISGSAKDGSPILIRYGVNKSEIDKDVLDAVLLPSIVMVSISSLIILTLGLMSIRYVAAFVLVKSNLKSLIEGQTQEDRSLSGVNEIDELIMLVWQLEDLLLTKHFECSKVMEELSLFRVESEKLTNFKDGYIKALSLDIRTPVESIAGLMELIADEINDSDNDAAKKYVNYCRGAIGSLGDILRELLDIESIESNGQKVIPITFDVVDLMSDFSKLYSVRFGVARAFFSVVGGSANGVRTIVCDSGKLTRLLNIVLESSIVSNNSAVTINWDVSENSFNARIVETPRLTNSTIEIPVSALASNASAYAFFRAVSLARILNGNLSLKIEEGGERVTEVVVPIGMPFNDTCEKVESVISAVVIDKNRASSSELAAALFALGVDVKTFHIPELGYFWLGKHLPDLLFMDFYLDGLSGSRLSRIVKEHGKVIPIVCMVSKSDAEKYKLGCEYFDYVLAKPVDQEELKRIVASTKAARITAQF